MNKRFEQLAEKAGYHPDVYELCKPGMEKFAELIVRECIEQVWYTREDGINGNVSEVIKDRIKQHFGVEDASVDDVDRILQTVRTRGQQ